MPPIIRSEHKHLQLSALPIIRRLFNFKKLSFYYCLLQVVSNIFDILSYYYICLCTTFLLPLRFGWLLVLGLHKENYLQIFKCVSFWLHGCCGLWEGWALVNRLYYTSGMTAVTPTDSPNSVLNRYVMKVLGAFLCCHVAFWRFLWV